MKRTFFKLFQPATVAVLIAAWGAVPDSWLANPWLPTAASIATYFVVQALEFVNERHAGWRLDRRELLTDLFYLILYYAVILELNDRFIDGSFAAAKEALGIRTAWALRSPFVLQVALALLLVELGQYWLHRLMHNSPLWWVHAPHHHLTQLNAIKGLVGNPIELLLVSVGVTAFFDLRPQALLCAFAIVTAVSSFAHANVRFDPPRWYACVFTTIEAHSLHHRVGFAQTRCNYANVLIILDRLFGTFRAGEAQVVGQDQRKRLSIREQFLFPLRPLLQRLEAGNAGAGG